MTILRWILGKLILFFDALTAPRAPASTPAERERLEAAFRGHALYEYRACPFCVKVRRHLKRSGIELPLKDAKVDPARSELLAGGGRLQVPCLRIEGEGGAVKWLYESDDIIRYLDGRVAGR